VLCTGAVPCEGGITNNQQEDVMRRVKTNEEGTVRLSRRSRRSLASEARRAAWTFVIAASFAASPGVRAQDVVVPTFVREPTFGRLSGVGMETVVRTPPERAALAPGMVQVQKRPAISFVPFEMVDPRTRQPVAPDAIIALPNGKRVTAGTYYAELNAFERWANEQGYSLKLPHSTVAVQRLAVNRELLQSQQRAVPAIATAPRTDRLQGFVPRVNQQLTSIEPSKISKLRLPPERLEALSSAARMERFQVSVLDGAVIDLGAVAKLCVLHPAACAPPQQVTERCEPVSRSKTWSKPAGDVNSFYASVDGRLGISGEACGTGELKSFDHGKSHFSLTAEGRANGSLFGHGAEILRLSGAFDTSAANSTVSANLGVYVLGQAVYTFTDTRNAEVTYTNSISKGVDFGTSIALPLGPFSIDLTVGARGDAGLSYDIHAQPLVASGSISPIVHTSVYAQAGLDVYVAEAGVGVEMTLLNWDMHLAGKVGVGWAGEVVLFDEVYAYTSMDMLSGSLYAYLKVYYPCWSGWHPDICSDRWDTSLWSWDGFHAGYVLFDEKGTHALHWT
jgi:hypothetical protein